MLPLNLPELEVWGIALVTSIYDCPPIASGEGSVVAARFVTREVHVVASVDVLGADGSVETITGTTIHPIWSVDRQEWVPMGELTQGEHLLSLHPSPLRGRGTEGEGAVTAIVLSVTLSRVTQPVYNIEVHGEHVYQVGELGLLVHNACPHVDGGVASAQNVLQGAITFLRSGYRDMGKGRFLSEDGLRQIRWGIHELNPLDMHIHFEHYDLPWDIGGKVIESTYTMIR